jgi:hypothetical protein
MSLSSILIASDLQQLAMKKRFLSKPGQKSISGG